MKIPLDRQSTKPVYLQISDRLSRLIKSGALPPGGKLPSIRCLAETTHVNKLTVIEAYGILEADGLVEARQGSGYFVNKIQTSTTKPCTFAPAQQVVIPEGSNPTFFETYYASIDAHNDPDTINFHFGVPAPTDLGDLQKIARRSLSNIGENVFNYDIPEGQLTLRKQIVQILIQRGLEVSPEQLMITNGSKQGMSLVVNHYVQPGDWVIVESPTYVGILAMLENLGARVIGIPMTGAGMNLELLSKYLHSHRPRLIYTISTLHNPTGITTNEAHRRELLNLAQQYSCPILEDNAYEGLNFEPVPPPIKALDQNNLVTYIGTFSKTLMPGLRVGYMVAPKDTHQALLERKFFSDFHTSTVTQGIVSEYLASGHYRRHLSHLKSVHLDNRNIMLKALETHFPTTCSWTVPKGGVFLWVTLPEGVPLQEICQQAAKKRVIVGNGALFFPGKQSYPAMRLSFSAPPEDIEYGIMTLGEIVKSYL